MSQQIVGNSWIAFTKPAQISYLLIATHLLQENVRLWFKFKHFWEFPENVSHFLMNKAGQLRTAPSLALTIAMLTEHCSTDSPYTFFFFFLTRALSPVAGTRLPKMVLPSPAGLSHWWPEALKWPKLGKMEENIQLPFLLHCVTEDTNLIIGTNFCIYIYRPLFILDSDIKTKGIGLQKTLINSYQILLKNIPLLQQLRLSTSSLL